MKKSRFTEEQMVQILREADAEPVSKVGKRYGVSEQSIYTWRKRYGKLEVSDVRRLRELEAENARLRRCWRSGIWRSTWTAQSFLDSLEPVEIVGLELHRQHASDMAVALL